MANVVFCLTGDKFSGAFLNSWTRLISWCYNNGVNCILSNRYYPNIYKVRNFCLGGDFLKGADQKPFQGKIDYTHVMWLDNDIIFESQHFQKLLEADKDFISGIYRMANGDFATVQLWDESYLMQNGHFKFLKDEDLQTNLMPVAYTGLGFSLVKKGALERLKFPWFKPEFLSCAPVEFVTEDIYFCRALQREGVQTLIDPSVILGHEKQFVI